MVCILLHNSHSFITYAGVEVAACTISVVEAKSVEALGSKDPFVNHPPRLSSVMKPSEIPKVSKST